MKEKYYSIYEINKETKEIEERWGSEERKEIANWLGIDYKNLHKYITKSLDNINCKLKDEMYFIMIDNMNMLED